MTDAGDPRLRACRGALRAAGIVDCGDEVAFHVPGRIEVLGKHTDYLGGRSLLAAVERGFCFVGAPLEEPEVLAIDAATGEAVRFPISAEAEFETEPGHWSNYVRTATRRLTRDFPGAPGGCALALASDLPGAAGMSSSSAIVTGTLLTLLAVQGIEERADFRAAVPGVADLAEYAAAVESGAGYRSLPGDRGVGTHGGSEDHTAILCARAGELVGYSFAPLRPEGDVPLPAGYTFAIASSGVRAEKTGAAQEKYNRLSALGRALLALWNRETGRRDPTLAAALHAEPGAADRLRAAAAGEAEASALRARLDHFVAESEEILPAATAALAAGELETFGAVVDRSQALASSLLGTQIPETEFLARAARELGAAAASAFGAGFGGSVWALVPEAGASDFLARWRDRYSAAYPALADAEFFLTRAAPPAHRIA
jgi:galactokinase